MEDDASDTVLLEGWLLRESTFVGHVVNRRAFPIPKHMRTQHVTLISPIPGVYCYICSSVVSTVEVA